jgi:hypothetical protein
MMPDDVALGLLQYLLEEHKLFTLLPQPLRETVLLLQTERRPGTLVGNVLGSVLRMVTYGAFFSVLVLLGSAVLRRAAATSPGGNGIGIAATPSLPGGNGAANYAPKEYNKVPHLQMLHWKQLLLTFNVEPVSWHPGLPPSPVRTPGRALLLCQYVSIICHTKLSEGTSENWQGQQHSFQLRRGS